MRTIGYIVGYVIIVWNNLGIQFYKGLDQAAEENRDES